MKKSILFVAILLFVALLIIVPVMFSERGTAHNSSDGTMRIAMITDSGDITDQSFNQTTYEACKAYSDARKIDFQYYKPYGDSLADRIASIDAAVQDDYNVIILPGYLFGPAIIKASARYPDIKFIGLDISEFDLELNGAKVPENVFCGVYQEEIPGYFVGYAAVKEGYKHIGFLGGMAVPSVIRFGYGYVQGAEKAAEEMGITDQVTVEYVYGGQFYGDQQIKAAMDGWYKNRGVEVVFACGGSIWNSAADAAKDKGGKLIGVDVDQSALINAYAPDMCVTSAMKGMGATINAVLSAIQSDCWAKYSGKVAVLGLASGTDINANYVTLPTDTWTMKNFTIEDYKNLVADIYDKKIIISSDISKEPDHTITVNTYPNIK